MGIHRCSECGSLNRVGDGRRGTPRCGSCKVALDTSGRPQPVTGEALERAIQSSPVPIVVDFWASWCGPCRMAAPIFEALGKKRAGELLVLKIDTDAEQHAANRYGIRGIPTFLLFAGRSEIGRRSGVAPLDDLDAWISAQVGRSTAA